MISKNKLGVVVGSLLGLWHLVWSILVASGIAQWLINWVFRLHFIKPLYTITPFRLSPAIALIVITSVLGYVIGWVLGAIWNWLHTADLDPMRT
jgi:fructose-specific phosphotransferase system IIC component